MTGNEKIFLTQEQAHDAIRRDFDQYESQFDLFQELCPIITDTRTIVTKKGRNDNILITRGKKSKTQRINDHGLGQYLFNQLIQNSYPLPIMAEICSKVFQTRCRPGRVPINGIDVDGIWIETDMASFHCRQCGNCCRHLNYRNDCTQKDYRRWEALGREDILEKVMILSSGKAPPEYLIWREPGTSRFYPECPWLISVPEKGRFECSIQNVKPEFCRQYPLTRKHAAMTGCQGIFGRNHAF